MNDVFKQIYEMEGVSGLSKHDQLVNGILNAIQNKALNQGDLLPSVNNLINEFGFARETIAKAYKDGVLWSRRTAWGFMFPIATSAST
jgi:DNA-binding GntR family transcriptional regulator